MKNKFFLTSIFFLFFLNTLFAQLKIASDGSVSLATSNHNSWNSKMITHVSNSYSKSYVVDNNGNHTFYVRGDGYVLGKGFWQISDQRFKTKIDTLSVSTENLLKLEPKEYYYKDANNNNRNLVAGKSKKQFGFIAQDVQKLFPNLVLEDENGFLSVNYIEFIPLIIKKMKEQQKEINKQQKEIKKLNKKLGKENKNISKSKNASNGNEKSQITSTSTNTLNKATKNSRLQQNAPNPFSESTEIRYTLADNFRSARLYIFNMQGNEIKEYTIHQPGSGSIRINGAELNAGMYLYSLVVDKQIIDTKRMILTKK